MAFFGGCRKIPKPKIGLLESISQTLFPSPVSIGTEIVLPQLEMENAFVR